MDIDTPPCWCMSLVETSICWFVSLLSCLLMLTEEDVLGLAWNVEGVDSIFAVLDWFSKDESTYPSATVLDFHPPRRLSCRTSAPLFASKVAAVLRNECPVNLSGCGSFKNVAIFFGNCEMELCPKGWLVAFPKRHWTKNLSFSMFFRKLRYSFSVLIQLTSVIKKDLLLWVFVFGISIDTFSSKKLMSGILILINSSLRHAPDMPTTSAT